MITLQKPRFFRILTDEEMKPLFDPDNPICPFYGYIGNRTAVDTMLDIAYQSFEDRVHDVETNEPLSIRRCRKRIRLQGSPSCGKTTLVKHFISLMKLPSVITDGIQLSSIEKLVELLESAYKAAELVFEPVGMRGDIEIYDAPPSILFIDEAHRMTGKVQDAFLKATEASDGILLLDGAEINCREICFILGTNSGGNLRQAFKTRFKPIILRRHTRNEVAKIVSLNHPTINKKDCERIAGLKPIPREALAFAENAKDAAARRKLTFHEAIELLAKDEGVEDGGISQIGRAALTILSGSEGLSKRNLCSMLGIEIEEWELDVLPTLLATDRHAAYVGIGNRHMITQEGINFLKSISD